VLGYALNPHTHREICLLRKATVLCGCGSGKMAGNCHWADQDIDIKRETVGGRVA
jgi:hypothetical protein